MLKMPELPPYPTAMQVYDYWLTDTGSTRIACRHKLLATVTTQRRAIILQYLKDARNFEELQHGLVTWLENES